MSRKLTHSFPHSSSRIPTYKGNAHVRAVEAAAYLLRSGLLNVKGTVLLNVKQGRALLHWAWRLQLRMSKQWVEEGALGAAPFDVHVEPLRRVLTGGAGAGKTTALRVIEALLEFFLGRGCLMKSAPTNAAARLLAGDAARAT